MCLVPENFLHWVPDGTKVCLVVVKACAGKFPTLGVGKLPTLGMCT